MFVTTDMRILRGVGSQALPCGCLVGLYETYDGRTIALIDARNPACINPEHSLNAMVPLDEPARATFPGSISSNGP